MIETKKILAAATKKIIRPLVRILLRFDVSYSEFSEFAKQVYIDVAYKHFSIPNRKQTYSRVSVITGIPRKEVVRITELENDEQLISRGPLNRATQVITGWIRDPDFLDETGEPKELALKDESPSFEQLVEKYSGDITARAILDELIRVGVVEKINKNQVRLLSKGYVPQASEIEKLRMFSQHFTDLLSTGVHNITHESKDAYFQRQVAYSKLPDHVVEEFKQYSYEKSLELLIDFDRWLKERKDDSQAKPGESTSRAGVGVYFFKNIEREEKEHGVSNKS